MRRFALLMWALSAGCLCHAEVLDVGVFNVAPWVMAGKDGQAQGALVDFYEREVAPRAGVTLRWHAPVTVSRLLENLRIGKWQLTPVLLHDPERVGTVHFGKQLITHFEPCLAVLPTSTLSRVDQPEQLAGMTIAWTVGGSQPDFLLQPGIVLDRTGVPDWEVANLGKLRLGRVDAAYFSNPLTPHYFANRLNLSLRLVKLPVPPLELYAGFALNSSPSLRARIDRAIAAARAAGKLDLYLRRYQAAP